MNISKFIYDDVNLFPTLLNDLFPNIHCPEASYKNLNRIIKEILIKQQYILVSEQLVQQVEERLVLNTLAEAQTQMGMKTNLYTLNLKALIVIELYGTLDPLTLMNDNKLLTLANEEHIRLQDYCSLLFEVGDLKYTSPATISRCGMVYVDPENLSSYPAWKRWLNMNLTD
ncbi:unnamed protein product [Rotaria sp. Silwood2]|nr:unnamed protein product [Rotaria sp. Silwood2]